MAARGLSCLVLAICTISLCAAEDVFVGIDCGSSDPYQDENLISWRGDDSYVQNGESKSVKSNNSISRVMDTLRVFTTRKKNCYNIESMRRGRVIVRASFFYGNYDDKDSPPTFDLLLDGNHLFTVNTSSSEYFFYEVIYTPMRDSISVCVAQTKPDQYPFISALEVRGLEPHMYGNIDDKYPLLLLTRLAYGANATISFPDDPYGRIWIPSAAVDGLTALSGNVVFSGIAGFANVAPPAVLRNAVAAINPNSSMPLPMGFPPGFPPFNVSVHMNFYFSEVARLGANDRRSFRIFKDNRSFSELIIPPYGNFSELYASTRLTSNTTFSLVPNNDSTLPPLINALEVFLIRKPLINGTHGKDVDGLALLQKAFEALQGWSGDPCLPAPYSWDWINCSSDPTPRVTALFLGSFGLSGKLPDFSSMDALQTIDLHNNSLEGPIPNSLGALPKLKELNLADNHFSGSIPTSLSQKKGLNLVVAGNPDLCTSGESCPNPGSTNSSSKSSGSKKKIKTLPIVLGIIIPFFVIICIVIGAVVLLHHKRNAAAAASQGAGQAGGANGYQGRPVSPLMKGHKTNKYYEDNLELADQTNQHARASHQHYGWNRY